MEEENLENNPPQPETNPEPKPENPLQFIEDKFVEYEKRLRELEEDNLKFRAYHKATAEEIKMIKGNFKLLLEESE